MNQYIAAAVGEMDKVNISKLEYPGPGAMDPSSCRFLAAFTRALGAKRILEFGSGFSTLMMAREIEPVEGNYLLSIDYSPRFSSLAKDAYETSGCQAKVEFRVAPLRPRFYGPKLLLSYSLPAGLIEALGPFDLVLIDAPHHDYGCESVLYDVFPAVETGGYIVYDDANRADMEKNYLRGWKSAFGGDIDPVLLEGIGNGLSVIEKVSDSRPRYREISLPSTIKTLASYARLLLKKDEE